VSMTRIVELRCRIRCRTVDVEENLARFLQTPFPIPAELIPSESGEFPVCLCSEFFEHLAYCTISMCALVSTDLCQLSDFASYFIRINHGEAPVFLLGFSTLRLQETEGTCMARFEDGDDRDTDRPGNRKHRRPSRISRTTFLTIQ